MPLNLKWIFVWQPRPVGAPSFSRLVDAPDGELPSESALLSALPEQHGAGHDTYGLGLGSPHAAADPLGLFGASPGPLERSDAGPQLDAATKDTSC